MFDNMMVCFKFQVHILHTTLHICSVEWSSALVNH